MLIFDELKSLDRPIKIGIIGAGFMGSGITEVISSSTGMEVIAISDKNPERAENAFKSIGIENYKYCKNKKEVLLALRDRAYIATKDYNLLFDIPLDIIVEATGIPETGADVVYKSILNKINIATLTIETEVTVGAYLTKLAKSTGTVYTVCSGDEPAAIKEMFDFFKTLGFDIVCCGKGKNNPLDNHATPKSLKNVAEEKGLNPRILTEFVDGTKTMIEMCSVANSTGLSIDKQNMHGPEVNTDSIAEVLCHKRYGGILSREGVVDYVIGDLAPGVFLVAKHRGKIVNQTLKYLKIGNGPNYLFYRPFHLTSIEVPYSIALAILHKKPTLNTPGYPMAEVITISKKALKKGDVIDGIGGFTVYGGIETFKNAKSQGFLPIGISEGAEVLEDIPPDIPIKLNQVRVKDSLLSNLRKLQDLMYDGREDE